MKAVWDAKSQTTRVTSDLFDCMIAESLLSDGRYIPQLGAALLKYKVDTVEELAQKQMTILSQNPQLTYLFEQIEMPLVEVLSTMEKTGIKIDKECLKDVKQELQQALEELKREILEKVGYEINLSSPAQVGVYLAEKEQVPLPKTKSGQYATGELELLKFKNDFPIIEKILKFRELSKLLTTYTDTLSEKADEKGRIHTTYSQVSVNTGRLSSASPNLQNIPVGSEYGLKIKSCFVAEKGFTLLSFDYSQQELRILAHLTGEEKLIEAFNENRDVHKMTASQLFNTPYEKVTKKERSAAKTINFGIIYGMSSYGLSEGLQILVEEASKFINNFYANFPKIKVFYDTYMKNGWKDDVVTTLLGRRRFVKAFPQQKFLDNSTKRVLMNYPIQGTAAELMKLAMVKIFEKEVKNDKDIRLLLQIHDDLVFEIKDDPDYIKAKAKNIREIMQTIHPLSVPVEVSIKIGEKWGEMDEYKLTSG